MTPEESELRDKVELRDSLLKLYQNKEFQLIIKKMYLREYCADAIKKSTYPTQDRDYHIARAQAAGYLEQYLDFIELQGNQAEKDLINYIQGE